MKFLDRLKQAILPDALVCPTCGDEFPYGEEDRFIEHRQVHIAKAKLAGEMACNSCGNYTGSADKPKCDLCWRKENYGFQEMAAKPTSDRVCPDCNLAFPSKKALKGHYINGLCPQTPEAAPIFAADLQDLLAELEDEDDDHAHDH